LIRTDANADQRSKPDHSAVRVAVAKAARAEYPARAPFHPDRNYPEYRFGAAAVSEQPNAVYEAVREAFHLYGLDQARYGQAEWNPLGQIIRPGNRVVIKPNFVLHHNQAGHGLEPMVTHPSVLRAVADYAMIALAGKGSLVIADAPQADCDFEVLSQWAQLDALTDFYHRQGLSLDVVDLRKLRVFPNPRGYILSTDRAEQAGDPLGYVTVDLGKQSRLDGLGQIERLYGSDYDRSKTVAHHSRGHHEYCVARTILSADVILNVPKMKVHKKVGVTLNIKNLVGINGDKNYLPHYRIGAPAEGGDAYPDSMDPRGKRMLALRGWLTERLLTRGSRAADLLYVSVQRCYRAVRDLCGIRVGRPVEAGNWHGNDTCWRMAMDLNAILFFADAEGKIHSQPQRRFFSIVDGIIGGEGNGPLEPDPAPSGLIAVGDHPWAVDAAVTRLMGFDWKRTPQLAAFQRRDATDAMTGYFRLDCVDDMEIASSDPEIRSMMTHSRAVNRPFRPHPGWVGHIELAPGPADSVKGGEQRNRIPLSKGEDQHA
jgi:uncharacterized protein (DUF362 family)